MPSHDTAVEIESVNRGHEWLKQKQFAGSIKIFIVLYHLSLRFFLLAISL